MINRKKLGYRINDLVYNSGKNQREIAQELKVPESSVSLWVNGGQVPSLESMCKISKYFGTTVDAILDGCVEWGGRNDG